MEGLKGSFRQTTCFRSYREQTLSNFHQQENESTTDLHTRVTVLLDKCNYNQCCINTCKVELFIYAVKYFANSSWARKQPADLAYNWLLDKAKSYETTVGRIQPIQGELVGIHGFLATVSGSVNTVHLTDSYNRYSLPGSVTDVV